MITSTNIGLNLPEGSDIFNHDTFLKQNFEKIDTSLAQNTSKTDKVSTSVLGNQNKIKGIAVTITNASTSATFSSWATKLSDIDCEVELCVMETISTDTSYDMTPVPSVATKVTEVKNTLNKTISMLKPHIGTVSAGDGFYRGGYTPSNIDAFFTNWGARLQAYAQICKDNNIPVLCISCEQTALTVTSNLSKWKVIISQCKTVYPALKITVAYTRFETGRDLYESTGIETLLDNVDIVGVNYYPNMLKTDPLKNMFGYYDTANGIQLNNNNTGIFSIDRQLMDLKNKFNKPIYLTEIGCTFYTDSTVDYIYPIYTTTTPDTTSQVTYIENVLKYLINNNIVDGLFLWHMDSPFAVVNSPTKDVIKKYFNEVV